MRGSVWLPLMLLLTGCLDRPAQNHPQLSAAARLRLMQASLPEGGGHGSEPVLLRSMVAAAPRDPLLQDRLALAAEQAGQMEEALAAQEQAIALGGASPARLLVRGRLALLAGQAELARRSFQECLASAPGEARAMSGLGILHDLAGESETAMSWHKAALAAAPQDWAVRGNAGMSRLLAAQPGDALLLLQGADQDPAAPRRVRHNLALALVAQNRSAAAEAALARDMTPGEARTLVADFARWSGRQREQLAASP